MLGSLSNQFDLDENNDEFGDNAWSKSKELTSRIDLERIRTVCSEYGEVLLEKKEGEGRRFIIDLNHRLAYCRNAKVC